MVTILVKIENYIKIRVQHVIVIVLYGKLRELFLGRDNGFSHDFNFIGRLLFIISNGWCLTRRKTISGNFKIGDKVILKKSIARYYDNDLKKDVEEDLPYWRNVECIIVDISYMYSPIDLRPVNRIVVKHNDEKYGTRWVDSEDDLIKI